MTRTKTPTFSPSLTKSPSATLTASMTPSLSATSTVSASATPTPGRILVKVNLYDATGAWLLSLPSASLGAPVTSLRLSLPAFSPNGDGVEDAVTITGLGTAGASWAWTGLGSSGQVLQPGVYQVVVESVLEDGSIIQVTASVVIRASTPALIQGLQIGPNPAGPKLFLRGQGKNGGRFRVKIYDVSAELVWRGESGGGLMDLAWDLTTKDGGRAASGVYIVVVDYEAGGQSERKIVSVGVIR